MNNIAKRAAPGFYHTGCGTTVSNQGWGTRRPEGTVRANSAEVSAPSSPAPTAAWPAHPRSAPAGNAHPARHGSPQSPVVRWRPSARPTASHAAPAPVRGHSPQRYAVQLQLARPPHSPGDDRAVVSARASSRSRVVLPHPNVPHNALHHSIRVGEYLHRVQGQVVPPGKAQPLRQQAGALAHAGACKTR